MSRGDGIASPSTMVSAPEADSNAGAYPATATDGIAKLPSAKQLIAAATSPLDRELPDLGAVARRRDGAGPSPKLQLDTRDTLPPPPYRRDHVVPVSSPQGNGLPHHSTSTSASRLHTLAPSPSHSQAEMEAQRAQNEAHFYRLVDLHTRDITSLGEALAQLDHNVRLLMRDMQDVRQQLHSHSRGPPVPTGPVDDRTLELFSNNLNQIAGKANEVDNVKVELALLKRKVARLEEQAKLSSPPGGTPQYLHREPSLPGPSAATPHHQHHTLPSIPPISTLAAAHHPQERRIIQTPTGPVIDHSDPRFGEHRPPPLLPGAQSIDAETPSSGVGGWTSVNQSAKRPSDVNGRVDPSGTPLGSPKRPKLAPLEPRMPSNESHPNSSFEDHRELPHLRPRSTDAGHDIKQVFHPHPGHHPAHDPSHEDRWRVDPHRPVHPYDHGTSPTRGGRTGRGRGRRSGQEHELMNASPEWDREGWTPSQSGPDGYYQPMTPSGRGRGIIRRASGGLHHAPPAQHQPGAVMLQPGDPYAHTKKQRQKPTRNADGILIRKDGRPDMRSQSSAANLRKVHARKEEERQRDWEATHPGGDPGTGNFAEPGPPRSVSSDSQEPSEVQQGMPSRGPDESRGGIYGLGGGSEPASEAPASLSREDSGDAMRVDETQASNLPPSKGPSPEPAGPPSAGGSPIAARDVVAKETEDVAMEAAPSTTAPAQPADTAASGEGATAPVETE